MRQDWSPNERRVAVALASAMFAGVTFAACVLGAAIISHWFDHDFFPWLVWHLFLMMGVWIYYWLHREVEREEEGKSDDGRQQSDG